MIQTVLLFALGFTVACLLALLIAPAQWRRAVKLTTRRIEATMPITMADISADKDLLRAEYAVEMRRLEMALGKAKERAARHLMERNLHTVEIGKLETEIATLKNALAERTKASDVLEQTVRKRVPEVEAQQEHLQQVIATRDQELAERTNAFSNQTDALELAQKMIRRQEQEINRLREALETGAGDRVRLWGKQLSEDRERAAMVKENGKLNAKLSRLREDLAQLRENDSADVIELRAEMQRMADLMVSSKPAAKPDLPDAEPQATEPEPAEVTPDTRDEDEKTSVVAKFPAIKRTRSKRPARPRRSLTERLAALKRNKQKEDA